MDPLDKTTYYAHVWAGIARREFLAGHPSEAYEHLDKLYDFLDDEITVKGPRECDGGDPTCAD